MNDLRAKVMALYASGLAAEMAADLIIDVVKTGFGRLGGRPAVPEPERAIRQNIPTSVRFRVFERDRFTCRYCGRSRSGGASLVIDHVVPVASGGRNTVGNLVTSCHSCNSGKGASALTGEVPETEPASASTGAHQTQCPQQQPVISQQQPVIVAVARGRGVSSSGSGSALSLFSGSGPVSKISGDRDCDEEFDAEFWPAYPRKTGKAEARRVYLRKKPPLVKCLETLSWQRRSAQWLAEDPRTGVAGAYVPLPATWLNQGRWDDEPPPERSLLDPPVPPKVAAARAQLVAMALRGPPPRWGGEDNEPSD